MEGFRKVEDLSLEDARAEVWLFREAVAANLFFLMDEVRQTRATNKAGRDAWQRLRSGVELLSDAVTGAYFPTCFCCTQPIRPGDAVISDVTEGEMHAECPVDGKPSTIKPGDKVFVDPESIVIDEDHPEGGDPALKPDHIVAHAASRLYTDDQLAAKIEAAQALLAGESV